MELARVTMGHDIQKKAARFYNAMRFGVTYQDPVPISTKNSIVTGS